VGNYNLNSADQQGKKAKGSDPVSNPDQGRVPGMNRRSWDGRDSNRNACGVAHAEMVARGNSLFMAAFLSINVFAFRVNAQ
jgi:hypothetical protein